MEIKTYHPPPEPPPVSVKVQPISSKPSEEKSSMSQLDILKSGVRRSFASDEFEDENIHGISISDGESENYYAGIRFRFCKSIEKLTVVF